MNRHTCNRVLHERAPQLPQGTAQSTLLCRKAPDKVSCWVCRLFPTASIAIGALVSQTAQMVPTLLEIHPALLGCFLMIDATFR